jgi:hypothetical protein
MDFNWKNKLIVSGMAATLTLGGLTGCGDGEVDDQLDPENNPAEEKK